MDMLYPEENYVFVPMQNFTRSIPVTGEDEFILTGFDTQVSSELSSRLQPTSPFYLPFFCAAPAELLYLPYFCPYPTDHHNLIRYLFPQRLHPAHRDSYR